MPNHPIEEKNFIRHKLLEGDQSKLRKYTRLVVGSGSLWQLVKYEVITSFFGSLPGALGLVLRGWFYPLLFRSVGKGTVFGRHIVVRNADRITLGQRVVIDDFALIDARGGGIEGIVIGDEVIINRGVSIQAKSGPIAVGSGSDIGAGSSITSYDGVYIGRSVAVGGGCRIGGVMVKFQGSELESRPEPDKTSAGGRHLFSRGSVHIGDGSHLGWQVLVLNGARVGQGCEVGAGAVVRDDVPDSTIAAPHQRLLLLPGKHVS